MDSLHESSITSHKQPPPNYIYTNGINGGHSPLLLPSIDLPVIDFTHFKTPSSDSDRSIKELAKLRSALSSLGCVIVTNHGVESSLLDRVRLAFERFVGLPAEEKARYEREADGFDGFGSDPLVADVEVHDWCARLRLTLWPQEKRQMKYWPQNPEDFSEALHEYSSKLRLLHDSVLKAMARSLHLEDTTFLDMIGEERTLSARFNFYPPCSTPDRVLGLRPHSDATVITFLLQDREVEGLQILKDGQWFRVPVTPDALLLFVGDQLEIMSNGEFKSPIHRAVVNSEKQRISLAMLSFPEVDSEIEPAKSLVTEERPKLFRMVKYNRIVLLRQYQSGKRATDEARIRAAEESG